ncbi:MAG: PQQ-binding-like beta-propeller repeat protein [Opitutales bacterium]
MMKKIIISITTLLIASVSIAEDISQFRGEGRKGVYSESGLLKTWGEGQPKLLWQLDNIGEGYLPPSVVDGKLYLSALDADNKKEMLKVLDLNGKLLWELEYGNAWKGSYKNSRTMPNIVGDFAYMATGAGEVVCVDLKNKKIAWSVDAVKEYDGKPFNWGYGENVLVADNKVMFTVGGYKTALVAFDAMTGKELWKTKSFEQMATYVSPLLIEHNGKKQVVAAVAGNAFGVDLDNGEIIWQVLLERQTPEKKPKKPNDTTWGLWKISGATPIYKDGKIFLTAGYDSGSLMLELPEAKGEVKVLWKNPTFDNHHGGIVLLDGKLYGANWNNNNSGNWQCVDWQTGETIYNQEWEGFSKGSVVSADGLLYVYEEKRGEVALVNPKSDKFDIISSFTITDGKGPHWAHIVIADKVMYIKRGEVLFAYDIKE